MKSKHITNCDSLRFETELNEFLQQIQREGIISITYHSTSWTYSESDSHDVEYSVLIIYKEL